MCGTMKSMASAPNPPFTAHQLAHGALNKYWAPNEEMTAGWRAVGSRPVLHTGQHLPLEEAHGCRWESRQCHSAAAQGVSGAGCFRQAAAWPRRGVRLDEGL